MTYNRMPRLIKVLGLAVAVWFMAALPLLALPPSGNSNISQSPDTFSGPPVIGQSGDWLNTAVAWTESSAGGSNGFGSINLSYAGKSALTWNRQVVDAATSNSNPVLAFDSILDNVVHLAYEKRGGNANVGIFYARCVLGGNCDLSTIQAIDESAEVDYYSPVIATTNTGPFFVYVRSVKNSHAPRLFYDYIYNGVRYGPYEIGGATNKQNQAVAAVGNKLHLVYAQDANGDGKGETIQYARFTVVAPFALTAEASRSFNLDTQVAESDLPSVYALGQTVVVVWQVKDTDTINKPNTYHLVYNISYDGGDSWISGTQYKFIPSNRPNIMGPADKDDDFINPYTGAIRGNLRPAVTLQLSGSLTVTHVVWQGEDTPFRQDVFYSSFDGSRWQGAVVFTNVTPLSYTNVTSWYSASAWVMQGQWIHSSNPRLVFNPQAGNRVEIVDIANVGDVTQGSDVMFNGWQFGDAGQAAPFNVQDSDADTLPDSSEAWTPPTCTHGAYLIDDNYAYNCDNNQDRVPDMIDPDSDGDGFADNVDPEPRNPDIPPHGPFLPIIVKNN